MSRSPEPARRASHIAHLVRAGLAGIAAVGLLVAPAIPGDAASRDEVRAGRRVAAEIEGRFPRLNDPARLARVQGIARKLETAAGRRPGSITYRLLDSPLFNALTIPGDTIYVMRGLVDGVHSDDELAAALAHEISHVTLGHPGEMVRREEQHSQMVVEFQGADGRRHQRVLPDDPSADVARQRQMELDADHAALPLLRKAGYRPEAALTMLESLAASQDGGRPAHSAAVVARADTDPTHPSAAERIRRVEAFLAPGSP